MYSVTIPFLFSIHCFQNDESNNDVVKRKDNTGVDSLVLLQGIFPIQGSNPGLPNYRQIFHCVSHQGNPRVRVKVAGVGSLFLLQGDLPTKELNQGLLHYRRILYQLSYPESPLAVLSNH